MPNYTPNLNLNKPLITENYDIAKVTNENADILDANALNKMTYKGTVASYVNLPSSNQKVGDFYYVTDVSTHYVWTGSAWRIVGTGVINATDVDVDTTNFTKNLSNLDDTVQKALDTLDNMSGGQMLGNATVKAISYNAQTIAENITIPSGYNCMSVGAITIGSGYTVTLEDNSIWVII